MRTRKIGLRAALMTTTLLATSAFAYAQNWPSFRGPNASGAGDGKPVPVKWDAEKNINIAWKTPIPGLAHSSPVVWGDKVFITAAVSANPNPVFNRNHLDELDSTEDLSKHTWIIYCLDKKTGKILWQRTAYEGIPKTKRHSKSSFANATPATDGKSLVTMFASEGLYCYDLNGNLKWKRDLGTLSTGWFFDPDYHWGPASSPVIYKDMVIVQCDMHKNSFIAAYSLKDGKQVWRTAREEISSWGTPTVIEGKERAELVTNAPRAIRGYDPATGRELWKLTGNPEITVTTPIAANSLIFICNGFTPNQPIYAIKQGAANGDISLAAGKTSNEYLAWSAQRGGSYTPTPLAYGSYLYVCANHGVLRAYEAQSGKRIYEQRIGGAYSASPIAANGHLYFASEDGDVIVVKAGATYEIVSSNPMGEVLMATPAISNGMIIIRGQKYVYGIIEKDAMNSNLEK